MAAMQVSALQQSTDKSTAPKAAKPVRTARQPTTLVTGGQIPHARNKTTRGLVARPTSSPTSTPEPPGGLLKDADAVQIVDKHSIGRAISRGRSGVNDVQGLLTRQPSVHPPVRNHLLSGAQHQPEGLKETTAAAVMAQPCAVTAAGKVNEDLPTQGHNSQLSPSLSVGTAGSAGSAALSTGASISAPAAKKAASEHEGHSRPPSGLQGHVAKAAAEGLPRAATSLQLARATPTSRADSVVLASSDDQAPAPAPAHAPLLGPPQFQARSAPDCALAAVGPDAQAPVAQPKAPVNIIHRHSDHPPSLQLLLTNSASDNDVAGGSRGESESNAANDAARGSGLLPRIGSGHAREASNMHPVESSGTGNLQAFHRTDHGSLPALHGADTLQLPDKQQSMQSSRSGSRTRSVTFGRAAFLHPGGQPYPAHAAQVAQQQTSLHREARTDSRQNSGSLVRLSSSLAAAVSETMQDRMLAGGMMHRNLDFGDDDRCAWPRARSSLAAREGNQAEDRCLWPRTILKHTANEQPSRQESSSTVGSAARDARSRRSMPSQLARHQSSLNQVSRRPDFTAAMTAVRASWRAEQTGQIAADSTAGDSTAVLDAPDTCVDNAQSSFDNVWASISHQQ